MLNTFTILLGCNIVYCEVGGRSLEPDYIGLYRVYMEPYISDELYLHRNKAANILTNSSLILFILTN
jgi:hypothetical protein